MSSLLYDASLSLSQKVCSYFHVTASARFSLLRTLVSAQETNPVVIMIPAMCNDVAKVPVMEVKEIFSFIPVRIIYQTGRKKDFAKAVTTDAL